MSGKMRGRRDDLAVITMILMVITTIAGILSINFTSSYDFINQYGQTVSLYGYGIYAHDSYFKAPISIGTDFCILFVLVPLFLHTYLQYRRKNDSISELKLISVYAVAFYYAASIAFGVTYNQLFLVYTALFSCSLFGMFMHIKNITWNHTMKSTKGLTIFLVLSGLALIVAWLPDVIPTIMNKTPLPLIGVYTTEITYVLDMGIISPLCFVTLYLVTKKSPLGTMILAILLKACIIVGIMMVPQTICQVVSGVDMELPVMVTKSLSFVLLGGFAFYFDQRLYKEIEHEKEK
ncbi:MAG: hypothetical protein E7256_03870 [Lachnospiraceae bacterium]|nr:hypothetical protein [Lachnospiraceae bacterium]